MNKTLTTVMLTLCLASPLFSQDDFGFGNQDDPLSGKFGGFGAPQSDDPKADFFVKFVVKKGTREGELSITGSPDVASHSHLYSQKKLEFQTPTEFTFLSNDVAKLVGPFVPDVDPEVVKTDVAGTIWTTEEFSTDVTWTAPIEFMEGVDIEKAKIKIQIDGQVCRAMKCLPFDGRKETASFEGYITAGPYRASLPHSDSVEWIGTVTPSVAKPGDTVVVALTATIDESWHIYSNTKPAEPEHYSPTAIVFSKTGSFKIGDTIASEPPQQKSLANSCSFTMKIV